MEEKRIASIARGSDSPRTQRKARRKKKRGTRRGRSIRRRKAQGVEVTEKSIDSGEASIASVVTAVMTERSTRACEGIRPRPSSGLIEISTSGGSSSTWGLSSAIGMRTFSGRICQKGPRCSRRWITCHSMPTKKGWCFIAEAFIRETDDLSRMRRRRSPVWGSTSSRSSSRS